MNNNGWKVGILSGIISSLLIILLIQPALRAIWSTVLGLGGWFHQSYVDVIYRNAAMPEGGNPAHLVAYILVYTMLLGLTYAMDRFGSVLYVGNVGPLVTPGFSKFIKMFLVSATMACALVILVYFSIMEGTLRINSSFTQRLTVLAPAISEVEYKTFRARWASMRGKSDYDMLVSSMDKRAAELGITLPRP